MNISNPTLRAVWRMRWAWLAAIVLVGLYWLFPMNSVGRLISYKLLVGSCAFTVAHILTKSVYDYISLSTLLKKDEFNEIPDSIKFVGACIIRGMVESAFTLGAMLSI